MLFVTKTEAYIPKDTQAKRTMNFLCKTDIFIIQEAET